MILGYAKLLIEEETMNEKETAELRRRFKPGKNNIPAIRGCYVNEKREIVSQFSQPLSLMPEDECEKFLTIMKKSLSGTLGKNLMDIEFSTQQVVDSDEHGLLMALRDSRLQNEEAVGALFARVIEAVTLEDNYLILLACDSYDVPYRGTDGEKQPDASSEVFSYLVCSVCPVKATKPALSYFAFENEFHSRAADWLVAPPELGFLFPAFDDRAANIYGALYYSRDTADIHEDFIEAIFKSEPPMPAAEQKETFQSILSATLADDCNYEVVQGVHGQLQEMIEEHKAAKEEEPLTVSKTVVRQILRDNGVPEARMEAFEEQFDAGFGAEAALSPRNIVDTRHLEVLTPDVTIHVSPGRGDLVKTRIIDGARYILIRADEGVELNGVPIHITE